MINKDDLLRDIKNNLLILPGDTLLIHSSMKSIGSVEGGADTVLEAFMEHIGESGLLVFPTLSYRDVTADKPFFDVRSTPACTGILSELFRQKPNVIRSLHPTHSVAAFGRDAAEFTAGHENCSTPAPVGSPWWKLLQRKGKILFIGTGISCNTFLHGVDEWLKLPDLISKEPVTVKMTGYDGNTFDSLQYRHCAGRNAYYGSLEERFEAAGALLRGKLGDALCHVLDCAKIASELGYRI